MRHGAKVIKRYSPPVTPCDRVMQQDEISARVKNELREYRAGLDPVALLRSMRQAQSAMATMSSPQLQETHHSESIDRFLARLPSLWQQGEARPTHKARVCPPRHLRTCRIPSKAFVRRGVVAPKESQRDRQGSAGKTTPSPSRPVRRYSTANAAAQSEGLARRHGDEAGLRRI